jgi:hypothetical protein
MTLTSHTHQTTKQELRDIADAVKAWDIAEWDLKKAKHDIETIAQRFHGRVPVRAIARQTGLSPATVSDFFRGRLKVSREHARQLLGYAVLMLTDEGQS